VAAVAAVIAIVAAKNPVIAVVINPKIISGTMVIAVENTTATCAAIAAKDTLVGLGPVSARQD